jgi:hypothetical protein
VSSLRSTLGSGFNHYSFFLRLDNAAVTMQRGERVCRDARRATTFPTIARHLCFHADFDKGWQRPAPGNLCTRSGVSAEDSGLALACQCRVLALHDHSARSKFLVAIGRKADMGCADSSNPSVANDPKGKSAVLNGPSALAARWLHPVNTPRRLATPRETTGGRVDGDGLS